MENINKDLSEILYKLFVVNSYAAAIQQEDGKYRTKYFPFRPFVIESMLNVRGSIGCYQQGFKNGLVKWICFDFDCKDRDNPDVLSLYNEFVKEFLARLQEYDISYLTEFSGRRGIHVWIIFDNVISKKIAYNIMKELSNKIEFNEDFESKFDIDYFPATDSAKGNKVGKQVKLPLSYHKNGGQSFFFENEIDKNCIYDPFFLMSQLGILQKYKLNDSFEICSKLKILINENDKTILKYKKYNVLSKIQCSVYDIERILGKTKVYKNIFNRMKSGIAMQKDWFVILGTLGVIDNTGELLKVFFSQYPAYEEDLTKKNILKWKNSYYPATFQYLYDMYGIEIESNIEAKSTGLEMLLKELGEQNNIEIENNEINYKIYNEKMMLDDVILTIEKECKYILNNDENVSISIWNSLKNLRGYDLILLKEEIKNIKKSNYKKNDKISWIIYNRYESEDKERQLVSLGAYERVLTTNLAMQLSYRIKSLLKSYSYNVFYLSGTDIFYNWFTSWGNYIDRIRTFLEIPYLNYWGVLVIDIKSFYDNIDFLAVYRLLQCELDEEEKNIFKYLIEFNEAMMRGINGSRIGVPQGPAYARIIAEMFLNAILDNLPVKLPEEYKNKYKLYRYVDDIVVFYEPNVDGNLIYQIIEEILLDNGLRINKSKSRMYGIIEDLSEENRKQILHKNKFNYQLQVSDISMLLTADQKNGNFNNFFGGDFNINDVAYVFGSKTDEHYANLYLDKYGKNIFAERNGRGSIFANFYKYLFSHSESLIRAVEANYFDLIDIETLNFKNCISQLYLAIQNSTIDYEDFDVLKESYLSKLSIDKMHDDERTTIKSLMDWR